MKETVNKTVILILIPIMIISLITVIVSVGKVHGATGSSIVNGNDSIYSYLDMKRDITKLCQKYSDKLSSEVIATTADNRKVYALCLGNKNAENQIVITASIHAREYRNTQAVMMMVEKYCKNYSKSYKGVPYKTIFDKVCFYIVPMVNPDGVAIAQFGPSVIKNASLRAKVKKLPRRYGYSNWKSNARGVDLNRNYKMYGGYPSQRTYSSEGYPGPKRYSEPESKGIRDLLKSLPNIKAVINFHQMGRVIYYGYDNSKVKTECINFAKEMKSMTGYRLINENNDPTYGDLEHYIMHEYKIPYACVETGYGGVPVPLNQLKSIYNQINTSIARAAYMYYKKSGD